MKHYGNDARFYWKGVLLLEVVPLPHDGRDVVLVPLRKPHGYICDDCTAPAAYKVLEVTGKTNRQWHWCGLCAIGG